MKNLHSKCLKTIKVDKFAPNYCFKVTIHCKYEANPEEINNFGWNFNGSRNVSEFCGN